VGTRCTIFIAVQVAEQNAKFDGVKMSATLNLRRGRAFVDAVRTILRSERLIEQGAVGHDGGRFMHNASGPVVQTIEEAGGTLLHHALNPHHWNMPGRRVTVTNSCQVDTIEMCASVDVTPTLETYIRISFRGPELSPMQAADLLERFASTRFPFIPNVEWFVEIDARKWIHFSRRYTLKKLQA
jgi:hypothetical protein